MNTALAPLTKRNSTVCGLLTTEGKTFELDKDSPRIFDQLTAATSCGFPRSLMVVGKTTLDDAVARGLKLSTRSAELHGLLTKALRTPALLCRSTVH
jgi:hypothetical protein